MKKWKNGATAVAVLLLIVTAAIFVKLFFAGKFDSVESLQEYMGGFGAAGPLVLTGFQALQVVIPVLPGFLGCVVGAVLFGPAVGFWCNYIGISVGSIAAYFLARKFGIDIVLMMFSEKTYNKWSRKVAEHRSYSWFLFIATLLPLFPDDFLCYFSGLVKMDVKKYIWIIILGKPWCILVYSLVFGLIK